MTDSATKDMAWLQPKRQSKHFMEYVLGLPTRIGAYRIVHLAQDQAVAYLPEGRIRGLWTPSTDIQSDDIDTPSVKLIFEGLNDAAIIDVLTQYLGEQFYRAWESEESFTDEESMGSVAVERQVGDQDLDIATDDFSQWTSAQLASEILQAKTESDMPQLRKMILIAEDTDFTADQSSQLAPWFLNFAERHRDSSDPQDEAAVWSAIRTGASMLAPDAADGLCPLLQPGHSIETSLVAVKMLGRIFEAQPPTDVDQHIALAGEVRQIAESLLNRYAITVSQSAAMAHLAIYALAAMGSSEIHRMVEIVQGLGAAWFTRRAHRKLSELRNIWASRSATVSDEPRALLDRVIKTFGAS